MTSQAVLYVVNKGLDVANDYQRLKQEYAMLTDNDLLLVKGKEEELLGRLQIKLGQTKAEVQKIISEI